MIYLPYENQQKDKWWTDAKIFHRDLMETVIVCKNLGAKRNTIVREFDLEFFGYETKEHL